MRIKLSHRKDICMLIFIILGLFFFYSYFYSDILITTSHGINLWDILFSGNIGNYYALCQSDINNSAYQIYLNPGYDFPIYIIFAIWNFPLWVLRKITGINIWESVLAMIWAKSIIIFFTVLSVWAMCKICDTLKLSENKKMLVGLFVTSSFLSSCAVVNSQYDIINVFFMLEALDYFLKKNIKYFLINIAIVAVLKPFSFFLFFPLLLYSEKNILKILAKTITVLIPYIGFKILIPNHTQLTTYENVFTLFKNKIHIIAADIPIFIFVLIIFWMLCYMYSEPKDEENYKRNSVLISYIAFALFFMFCSTNPYWCIMLIPFQYLVMIINKRYICINTILETIGSLCLVGYYVIHTPWCFDARLLRTSFISRFFGMRYDTTDNVLDILHNVSDSLYNMLDRAEGILFSTFFVSTAVFIWINIIEHRNVAMENVELPKYVLKVRGIIALVVCSLPMIAYIM